MRQGQHLHGEIMKRVPQQRPVAVTPGGGVSSDSVLGQQPLAQSGSAGAAARSKRALFEHTARFVICAVIGVLGELFRPEGLKLDSDRSGLMATRALVRDQAGRTVEPNRSPVSGKTGPANFWALCHDTALLCPFQLRQLAMLGRESTNYRGSSHGLG